MEKARIPLISGVVMLFSGVAVLMVAPGFIASWLLVLGAATVLVTFLVLHLIASGAKR